jgi:2'-hydroxyisoflavone reductase
LAFSACKFGNKTPGMAPGEAQMNILIIGGTRFLGRHLVEAALAHDHTLTLFNRGKSNPGLYLQIETIHADRETDLAKLSGRTWDAVIDTCGYFPRVVNLSAQALKDSVGRYVFISSISFYADLSKIGLDEQDLPAELAPSAESVEEITGDTYGPLKALCEKAVEAVFHDRALILRPGLIVGPYDPTDRFTYWPVRVARGGEVLAPEKPQVPVQIIDARDLAEFIIHLIEQQSGGIYNATGPHYELGLGALLDTCKKVSGSDAVFRWAPVDFLTGNSVEPWSDMPVWIPDTPAEAGFSRVDISKAIAAGLSFRGLDGTIRDTLAWAQSRPAGYEWRAGLKPKREAELLKLLHAI